jgi:hypothetical protein
VGLISIYGTRARVERVECSVTVPAERTILAHTAWNRIGNNILDPVEWACRKNWTKS